MREEFDALWSRIEPLLDEALDLPASSRPAFLDRACSGDAELRAALEQMIAGAEGAHRALDAGGVDFAMPIITSLERNADAPSAYDPGTLIGPFRIVREIGRGGMGVVYLAERADPELRQQAALKVVRHGLEHGRGLRQRFLEERQILASLHHPHIATLYDGGMGAADEPWLAMEYVEGMPLDRYAREQALSVPDRLRLFLDVCDAVQYAHQHLVVHRDLKPSNILVTAGGDVKLLDFGIARLLDPAATPGAGPRATLTRAGTQPFTPEYASPEQVLGHPISTASDVYALGVVLYELLTGARPIRFAERPVVEWGAIVRDAIAAPPSSVIGAPRALRGDIDTIVLKAIRQEPARRYASAEQLADDIRRHLTGLPVRARADSWSYRAGKFAKRHGFALAAGTALTLAVLGGAAATARQARVARAEAKKATRARDFLVSIFASADPTQLRGEKLTAREVLAQGAKDVDTAFVDEPDLQLDLFGALGSVYFNLGMYAPADSLFSREVVLAKKLYGPNDSRYAGVLDQLGDTRADGGQLASAESLYTQALDILRRTRTGSDSLHAAILSNLGVLRSYSGRYAEAEAVTREALALLLRGKSSDRREVSTTLVNLASILLDENNIPGADSAVRRAVDIERRILPAGDQDLLIALNNFAATLDRSGKFDSAAQIADEVLARNRVMYRDGHDDLATAINNVAVYRYHMGDVESSEPLSQEAVAMFTKVDGPGHPHTLRGVLALGKIRLARHDHANALASFAQITDVLSKSGRMKHPLFIEASYWTGRALAAQGRAADAESLWVATLKTTRATTPPNRARLGDLLTSLGTLRLEREDALGAEPLLREARTARIGRLAPGDPEIAVTTLALAQCLAARGQRAEAESLFVESATRFSANRFRTREAEAARSSLAEWRDRWSRGGKTGD